MTSASSNETILINLDISDSNGHIDSGHLIQRHCYDSLEKQINADLAELDKRTSVEYPYGSGLVYFIDGTRGAGKSTFLHSTYTSLSENKASECKDKKRIKKLAYIDPSRIEHSEIILLSVLKALAQQIDIALQQSSTLRNEGSAKQYRDAFKKLAGGLSLFAEDHDQLKDLDPELFLDWGLARAGDSSDLRNHLHHLFDIACELLNAKALILAFDDADTNAKHAGNVLECIRKYLDTPKLVILVTGDLELYSLMVRDHFYSNLGNTKHEQGKERNEQRTQMVDHLEDQYLLKLFPIRRRVQLRPLWNLLERPPMLDGKIIHYQFACDEWKNKPRNPTTVLEELIRRGLRIKNSRDIALYREFLLKQPLRSILQVLSRCAKFLVQSDEDIENNTWNQVLAEALSESLHAMALGSLYKFGVDVDAIAARELPALIEAVFELTVRDGDMDTGAYLRPQPSDSNLKNCFAALSADVAGLCAVKPDTLIQYLLSGPGSVSLYGQVLRRKPKIINSEDMHKQFKQYMGVGRKENALNWSRHATPIFVAPYVAGSKSALVRFGVIGLHKRKPKNKIFDEAKSYTTIHSAIIASIASDKRLPVFALSLVDVSGTSNRTYASIYNILGLIERLLSLELSNKKVSNDILSILANSYPPLSISCPEWEGESSIFDENEDTKTVGVKESGEKDENEEGGEDVDAEPGNITDDSELSALKETIENWLKKTEVLRNKINPSAVLIGKIWTRLYFSLEKVSDDRRGKICAASLMELFALCVINAFFVEESDHHLSSGERTALPSRTLDRTNPLSSPDRFVAKLEQIAANHEKLPLTYLIATCPLILGLLRPSDMTESVISMLPLYKNKGSAVSAD